MDLAFIQLPGFVAEWKHFRLADEDLQALEVLLLRNPDAGVVMAGTGGVRKIRFAPPSRHTGKSGAFRVAYAYLRVNDTVILLSIFAKADQANLTSAQKAQLKAVVEFFRRG